MPGISLGSGYSLMLGVVKVQVVLLFILAILSVVVANVYLYFSVCKGQGCRGLFMFYVCKYPGCGCLLMFSVCKCPVLLADKVNRYNGDFFFRLKRSMTLILSRSHESGLNAC